MKEKEIRERVEQFLKRTARNVVMPASLGLGLSISGCEGNALRARTTDAGGADAGRVLTDTAITQDLPAMYLVYLVMMPDAAPDTRPADAETEAGSSRPDAGPDAGPDISSPPPPYMVPPPPSEDAMPAPQPPYLLVPAIAPPSPGGTAPIPDPSKKAE
jgi:hypothetical protein